jgi:phosphoglycolate phosphatase
VAKHRTPPAREHRRCAIGAIDRLILWNVDLTLLDVGRVSRDAYAEAFRRVTGRPLVSLPQVAGRSDSEIFLEALALNDVPFGENEVADTELLARYFWELEGAFGARQQQLLETGRLMPGAKAALAAAAALPGVVQSVLTGGIRPTTRYKLHAFGLDGFLDLEVGGYGSDAYPRGSLLMMSRSKAGDRYGTVIGEESTVYIADTRRDVEAASIGGARCIAVASGRDMAAELRDAGADAVLADLTETDQVIATIDRLTRVPVSSERR